MGQTEKVVRLVLDTNVLVSALLFRSETSRLFDAWLQGRFRLAVSGPVLDEYARVLTYPKFRLSGQEVAAIMEQFVLPFCDRFEPTDSARICADPDDDKFLHCAAAARAAALVSGDRTVLSRGPRYGQVRIVSVQEAIRRYAR